jgi:poly(A) polymerase
VLLDVLGARAGETRYVGGAVRDTLLGHVVNDVDLATIHLPQVVIERLNAVKIKVVPTGIAHGTVTAVLNSLPYEITTLRSDVSTDGRRATVAFATGWEEDAARRDFTINALYAHATTGEINDFFGGLEDLHDSRVRFIGDARARIDEDHLRILRYFRFFARFGGLEPDAQAYSACREKANSLMALSRERIADELLKLLALPEPLVALSLMIDGNIVQAVLPEITMSGLERLRQVMAHERAAGLAGSAILRLIALLPRDAATGDAVAARLKLSTKARKRINAALSAPPPSRNARELAYRLGPQTAQDILLLADTCNAEDVRALQEWAVPQLAVGGGALVALGLKPGPDISRALGMIKEQWIAEDFPDTARTNAIAAQIASKFQRDSQ